MAKPLCIDLFCGLGGWADGFLAEGYDVVGFDNHRHVYGSGDAIQKYPAQLVIQDVLTLSGRQFRDAAVIVASPPCQEFSYMAMPWKRGKQIAAALRGDGEFPEKYTGSRTVEELRRLFDACFRIASESGVPLVVENVRGAQPWVGPAKWNYGSFYLFGDVPALMPSTRAIFKMNPDGTNHGTGSWFAVADSKNRGGRKVAMNFHEHEKTGKPGRSFQSAAVQGLKVQSEDGGRRTDPGKGARFTSRDCGTEAVKLGGDWFNGYAPGVQGPRNHGSGSPARKAASAQIAKIPPALAQWIASVFKPSRLA